MYRTRRHGSQKFNEKMARWRDIQLRKKLEEPAPYYGPEPSEIRCRIIVEDYDGRRRPGMRSSSIVPTASTATEWRLTAGCFPAARDGPASWRWSEKPSSGSAHSGKRATIPSPLRQHGASKYISSIAHFPSLIKSNLKHARADHDEQLKKLKELDWPAEGKSMCCFLRCTQGESAGQGVELRDGILETAGGGNPGGQIRSAPDGELKQFLDKKMPGS